MRELNEERPHETYIEDLSLGPVYSETTVSGVKMGARRAESEAWESSLISCIVPGGRRHVLGNR